MWIVILYFIFASVSNVISVTIPLDDFYMFQSIALYGDQRRQFQLLASKLDVKSDANISLAFFGGSITAGSTPAGVVAYPFWLIDFLSEYYPHAKNRLQKINHGKGGTHPFHGRCYLSTLTPEEMKSDIFVLEFALNGAGSNHGWSYESLVKSIMLGSPDAIIICFGSFHWFTYAHYSLKPYNHENSVNEDVEIVVAQQYDVSYLSARKTFYYDTTTGGNLRDWVTVDGIHPTSKGQSYYASLIARYVYHRVDMTAKLPPVDVTVPYKFRPTVYETNNFLKNVDTCFVSNRLVAISGNRSNFEYGTDTTNGNMKDGFVTENGGWVEFFIDPPNILSASENVAAELHLHVLKGWDHIGDVKLQCVSASVCSCDEKTFSGKSERHTTETYPFRALLVWATIASEQQQQQQTDRRCTIRLSVEIGHQRIAAISIAASEPHMVSYPDGTVIQDPSRTMWLVKGDARHHIPNPDTFDSLGVPRAQVQQVSMDMLEKMPEGQPVPEVE